MFLRPPLCPSSSRAPPCTYTHAAFLSRPNRQQTKQSALPAPITIAGCFRSPHRRHRPSLPGRQRLLGPGGRSAPAACASATPRAAVTRAAARVPADPHRHAILPAESIRHPAPPRPSPTAEPRLAAASPSAHHTPVRFRLRFRRIHHTTASPAPPIRAPRRRHPRHPDPHPPHPPVTPGTRSQPTHPRPRPAHLHRPTSSRCPGTPRPGIPPLPNRGAIPGAYPGGYPPGGYIYNVKYNQYDYILLTYYNQIAYNIPIR